MAEENQVQQEPQQVTTKNLKKVEAGKKLAAYSCKKREKKREVQKNEVSQYYGIGAVIAVGVIGGLGHYIFRNKKGHASREVKDVSMPHNPPKQPPQSDKFEMD